jgi:CRP/FNR family transcriptional regulator, cyclic AMP receptor protein
VSDPKTRPARRALEAGERIALREDMAKQVLASHLFKSLDEEGREKLLDSCDVRRFAPNDVIMKQDEPGEEMFLILTGTVSVETKAAAGTVQLAELGRGACVGEVSVLTGGGRTATVTALTDVECATFQRPSIDQVLDLYPKVRELLDKMVEGRARDTIEKIITSS